MQMEIEHDGNGSKAIVYTTNAQLVNGETFSTVATRVVCVGAIFICLSILDWI